jgi:hypothetical protein
MPHGPAGTDKAAAEQKLMEQAVEQYPHLFTKDRLWLLDRNFPGAARIARLIARTHVLIRLKSDIALRRITESLPDGSYLAELSGDRVTVTVRVIEYWVTVEGQDVPEMFCLITDLTDIEEYPAPELAGLYKWRWDGSETALREAKASLNGAGPGTGPMLRSGTPDLIRQELAARRRRHRDDLASPGPPPSPRPRRGRAAAPGSPSSPARSPMPAPAARSSPRSAPGRRATRR